MMPEQIVTSARLWNGEAIARHAKNWWDEEGSWFRKLRAGQLSALERNVSAVEGKDGFFTALKNFTNWAVEYGRSPWTAERSKALRAAFDEALEAAANPKSDESKAFKDCERLAPGEATVRMREKRDEQILRAYLATLARKHKAEAGRKEDR